MTVIIIGSTLKSLPDINVVSLTCKIGLPAPPPPPHDPPKHFFTKVLWYFYRFNVSRENFHCKNVFTGHFQNGRQRKWNLFNFYF